MLRSVYSAYRAHAPRSGGRWSSLSRRALEQQQQQPQRHGRSSTASIVNRSYWWSSSSSGSGDDESNQQDKKTPLDSKRNKKNNGNGEKQGSSTGPSSSSSSALVPTRLGFGDEAPRYPHLIALPVITRPVFPGIVTSVTLTNMATIEALEKISNKSSLGSSSSPGGYISVFLRRKYSSGVSEGGVILEQPEFISNVKDLHSVGTFAQIHKVTRGVAIGGLHVHPASTDGSSHFGEQSRLDGEDDEENSDSDGKANDTVTTASVLLLAHRRVDLISLDEIGPPIDVTVSHWDKLRYQSGKDSKIDDTIKALSNEILSTIREVAQLNPLFREHIHFFPTRFEASDPYRLADFAASLTTGSPEELQAVLEERDVEVRLHKALVLLSKEREVSKLQQEISRKVEEKMSETQRKYFLTEQLKSIKKELGMEKDDKEALLIKYRDKLNEYGKENITAEVLETIESELEKLSTLEKNSSEFNVTRSYLDWLTNIPWGVTSKENFEIKDARRILDRDHYGLEDVKDLILECIAVGKLKGTIQGKILCLVGPPGVGKTSIAESVADALGRKFFRFSVGGLSDVSEIKGHRRTYVGAMPGKLIQCLKSTGTTNPLVLIDEIDKLGRDYYRGDPSSALLEVLDPSQNSNFRDHFMDVPVDMSKVLFMCTANSIENIPNPLLDRMEVIRLSGYDVPEKVAIAEQYLVPKAMRESGLLVTKEKAVAAEDTGDANKTEQDETKEIIIGDDEATYMKSYTPAEGVPESLVLEKSAIESLVRWYCREAGVRNLSKHIEKIARKLALQVVAEAEGTKLTDKSSRKSDSWQVSAGNLHEYVGKPIFTSDRLYEKDPLPHGIVMGLAWTSMGGSALYVETQAIRRGVDSGGKTKGGGTLKVTGQLGKVMEESAQIAYTVARARLGELMPHSSYFDDNDIHMHVPEGATPKDGPSAGITMTTAMLSLALDIPIKNDLTMSGEISLTGKVLPVGGIKEKTMAAKRAGIKSIIFPAGNKRDFDEMPGYLKEGLEVHFAEDYSAVYDIAFET